MMLTNYANENLGETRMDKGLQADSPRFQIVAIEPQPGLVLLTYLATVDAMLTNVANVANVGSMYSCIGQV